MSENTQFRFRIGIINDFKNSQSFLDYKDYGYLKTFDASLSKGPNNNYQKSDDCIAIFLNFKLLQSFKNKEQAIDFLKNLLNTTPPEAKKDFDEHKEILYLTILGASDV